MCARLVRDGEEVHAFVKPTTTPWRLEGVADRLTVHAVDITDTAQVDRAIERIQPTIVYHLATHGAYPSQDEAEPILLVNVTGLWNLVRACSRLGFELFVNTGSSSEYGAKAFAMRETDVLEPDSFYAVAKSAQSLLCRHVARSTRKAIVTLRLFSVYGPYEEPTRLIPRLMMAAIDGKPIDMVSPATVRDFVYVDDVVDVYLKIDELRRMAGEILNVGTGVQTSLAQLVDALGVVAGRPIDARWDKMQSRSWDTNVWVADVSKLRKELGITPATGISQGLSASLDWFRRHKHLYGS